MAKTLITAEDVRAARTAGRLVVPVGALLTPLARDTALEIGVTIAREGQVPAAAPCAPAAPGDELAEKIRAIVASLIGSTGGGIAAPTEPTIKRPVVLGRIGDFKGVPFPYPGPPEGMEVATVDVVTESDGSPMAAGYMTITKGAFPWTLTYDEVQVVLEGELHLGGDAGDKVGHPGDIFYVPKGSSITFGTPNWAKFVYVTFPVNWEG